MRVAVLWTGLSGYLNACLRELASRPGVELFVSNMAASKDAPYEDALFRWIPNHLQWRDKSDLPRLEAALDAFRPELVVVTGWHEPIYRAAMKKLKGQPVRVMTMDNCWHGTLKQRAGIFISPFYVLPLADAAWVAGERQAQFARRLGFPTRSILRGLYSSDHASFSAVRDARIAAGTGLPKAFVFVGRLAPEKGIDTLAAAYEQYRLSTRDPWPLIVCGTGSQAHLLKGKPGVEMRGFVQPNVLPGMFAQAGCLVLPSAFEPWALVVHEATSAGLLVIASEMVGAVPHLVQDGFNGFVTGVGDAKSLADSMVRVSSLSPVKLAAMSDASYSLSLQFTPVRWADTLLEFVERTRAADKQPANL